MTDGSTTSDTSDGNKELLVWFEVSKRFHTKLWELWAEFYTSDGEKDPVQFNKAIETTYLMAAATLSLDSNETLESFIAKAVTAWQLSAKKAVRFS